MNNRIVPFEKIIVTHDTDMFLLESIKKMITALGQKIPENVFFETVITEAVQKAATGRNIFICSGDTRYAGKTLTAYEFGGELKRSNPKNFIIAYSDGLYDADDSRIDAYVDRSGLKNDEFKEANKLCMMHSIDENHLYALKMARLLLKMVQVKTDGEFLELFL